MQALQTIVSRQIDGRQPRVLTIGRIQGGTRFNIIADRVTMDGTLRTHDAAVRAEIKARMARTVKGVAEAHGTTATLRFYDDGNPPTVNDAALAAPSASRRSSGSSARTARAASRPQMVAEDFPFYGQKAPYFFFLLGTRNAREGHRLDEPHRPTFDDRRGGAAARRRGALATLAWDFLRRRRPR